MGQYGSTWANKQSWVPKLEGMRQIIEENSVKADQQVEEVEETKNCNSSTKVQ